MFAKEKADRIVPDQGLHDLVASSPGSGQTHEDDVPAKAESVVEDSSKGEQYVEVANIPLRIRYMAFSFVLFMSTGAAFAESTIGPLKSTLLRELQINSEYSYGHQVPCEVDADESDTQFSTVSTSSNVVNTLLPLIGGIAMDYVGGV